jgi:hypothetical protein
VVTAEQIAVANQMMAEAVELVATARRSGADLRLAGGLAVRAHCRDRFCARQYRDIDVIARRNQYRQVKDTFAALAYEENISFHIGSAGAVTQFYRPCVHAAGERQAHLDDRVDVYFDDFRLHHRIALRHRLLREDLTIPVSDVLLIKLQRTSLDDDDIRDALSLLKDVPLSEVDEPGEVNVRYIARVCARDWGLQHDVERSLGRCRREMARFGLTTVEMSRVSGAIDLLERALGETRKPPRWRLRALIGEALPWSDAVDDRDGQRISARERPI